MIDAADFQALVEAYGADARRWPADRRAAAEAYRAAEPEAAAAILALEVDLDEALDILRPPVASADLRARILASAPKPRAEGWRGMLGWMRPGVSAVMAASCVAGVVAGLLLVQPPERNDTPGGDLFAAVAGPGDFASDDDSELG